MCESLNFNVEATKLSIVQSMELVVASLGDWSSHMNTGPL